MPEYYARVYGDPINGSSVIIDDLPVNCDGQAFDPNDRCVVSIEELSEDLSIVSSGDDLQDAIDNFIAPLRAMLLIDYKSRGKELPVQIKPEKFDVRFQVYQSLEVRAISEIPNK